MENDYIAKASVTINKTGEDIWEALVNPAMISEYMFGTYVTSDWNEGSEIRWKGEWEGKTYEDKGKILRLEPGKVLKYSHYSPLSGLPDKPGNYHTVTIVLSEKPTGTLVSLEQDHNTTEESQEHSEKNWNMMLMNMKDFLEKNNPGKTSH